MDPLPNPSDFFYGIGPDDSLNSTPNDSIDGDATIRIGLSAPSSPASVTSLGQKSSTISGWQATQYKAPFLIKLNDFARVEQHPHQTSLLVRLYKGKSGPMAQVGDYENVDMDEILDCYRDQHISPSNLLLIVEQVDEKTFPLYKTGLTRLLSVFSSEKKIVSRCVLWMDCYYHVQLFADMLSTYCRDLVELNIGAPRLPNIPPKHPPDNFDEEAGRVTSLLESWLLANVRTIRCLRIYTCLKICSDLSSVLEVCPHLQHLTLSKIVDIDYCVNFTGIKSFELDKQRFGFSDDDIRLLQKFTRFFPQASQILITGTQFSPLTEVLIKSLGNSANRNFHVYTSEAELQSHIKRLCNRSTLIANEAQWTGSGQSISLKNNQYSSQIHVYSASSSYFLPPHLSNSYFL